MQDRLEYLKQYQQRRITEGKAYAIAKLGGRCAKCGAKDRLEFDHIEPMSDDSAYRVTQMFTFSRAKLDAELEKCQLLCVPCHKHKSAHIDRVHASVVHGTISAVRYCKPICKACRLVRNEYGRKNTRAYRARSTKVVRGPHKTDGVGSSPTAPTLPRMHVPA